MHKMMCYNINVSGNTLNVCTLLPYHTITLTVFVVADIAQCMSVLFFLWMHGYNLSYTLDIDVDVDIGVNVDVDVDVDIVCE